MFFLENCKNLGKSRDVGTLYISLSNKKGSLVFFYDSFKFISCVFLWWWELCNYQVKLVGNFKAKLSQSWYKYFLNDLLYISLTTHKTFYNCLEWCPMQLKFNFFKKKLCWTWIFCAYSFLYIVFFCNKWTIFSAMKALVASLQEIFSIEWRIHWIEPS